MCLPSLPGRPTAHPRLASALAPAAARANALVSPAAATELSLTVEVPGADTATTLLSAHLRTSTSMRPRLPAARALLSALRHPPVAPAYRPTDFLRSPSAAYATTIVRFSLLSVHIYEFVFFYFNLFFPPTFTASFMTNYYIHSLRLFFKFLNCCWFLVKLMEGMLGGNWRPCVGNWTSIARCHVNAPRGRLEFDRNQHACMARARNNNRFFP